MSLSDKQLRAEIVKSGMWTYDGRVRYEVWIVKQNFEYWFDEGFDEAERLNEDGESFVVEYAQDGLIIAGGSEHFSLSEAIAAAEAAIPQGIQWDDHRLQPIYGGRKRRLEPE